MRKKHINKILFIILGAILGTSITVCAYSYYAKDVEFAPTNESWEVDNANDAIDDLHNTSSLKIEDLEKQLESKNTTETTLTTKVSSLNSKVSTLNSDITSLTTKKASLENELSSLTDATVNISFNSSLEVQTFKFGFKPGYIACITNYNSNAGGGKVLSIYNKDYSTTNVIRAIDEAGNSSGVVDVKEYTAYYTLNSDGFTWNITSSGMSGSKVYCTVSK